MANIILYPPYGTREQSSSVKFEILDLDVDDIKLDIENVTDKIKIKIKHLEKIDNGYAGVMDLNIPEHSSQSSISVFTTIYKKEDNDSYKMLQICPSVFEVKEESEEMNSNIVVSPTFISQKGLCAIKVKGDPLSSSVFSVNDKIFKVMINEAGYGSIHFKGSDIVGKEDLDSLNKIPVYVYEGENKTKKVFSGSYVNIIPSNIAVHAELDPRCDADIPEHYISGLWTPPEECGTEVCNPDTDTCDCDPALGLCECIPGLDDCPECDPASEDCNPPKPCVLDVQIPTSPCTNGNVLNLNSNYCRVHNNSVVLLNNGMVMYAYTSPDPAFENDTTADEYNINRIFITLQKTSVSVDVLVTTDVVVESKTASEDFRIHVDEYVFDAVEAVGDLSLAGNALYIVLYDEIYGFLNTRITGFEIDPYAGEFILIGEAGNNNAATDDWVFCVNSVIFNNSEDPNLHIDGDNIDYKALSFVRNEFENGEYVQPVNVSIASNKNYVGLERETYVYVIAEAVTENNLSQLYFNSFSFGKTENFDQKEHGWVRLTDETQGNNRNPVIKMDSSNNLHIVFESDRGGINQLYYGNLGISNGLSAAASFSASIDKYSEFLSKGKLPFDYLKPLLLQAATDQEYFPIPEFDTQSILSEKWTIIQNGGSVSLTDTSYYLDDLLIVANPLSQEAMAIASIKILEDDDGTFTNPSFNQEVGDLLQYNYQISFKLEATVTQSSSLTSAIIVDKEEMDDLFSTWRSTFTVVVDPSDSIVTNQPIYEGENNNKFMTGRSDNIYDRIVPLVGAYKYDNPTNPSFIESQIKILKNDNNLKDFTFGIMFEKTYFKATNLQTSADYVAAGNQIAGYVAEQRETIYSGKAKLVAFIKSTDISKLRSEYIIVREFPEELNISESAVYDIIVNYTKIANLSGTPYWRDPEYPTSLAVDSSNEYVGMVTLVIDGVPAFSQTFTTIIDTDDYNFFDIGFGIPSGGYYLADKMSPSNLGVFDNVSVNLDISNITITSPTYTYNNAVVSLPPTIRDMTSFKVFDTSFNAPLNTDLYSVEDRENILISLNFVEKEEIKYSVTHDEISLSDYEELFNVENVEKVSIEFTTRTVSDRMIVTSEYGTVLYDTGLVVAPTGSPFKFDVDVTLIDNIYINVELNISPQGDAYGFIAYFKKVHSENTFIQVPITFEGINQSAALDIGICNDLHIAWQSNRSKNWDIYYANSVDKFSPFRYETQITNTESNSIKPSLSVNRSGTRLIAWNDNRMGNFNIYTARSLEGYECNQKTCEVDMLVDPFAQVDLCGVSSDYTPDTTGIYNFVLYFYSDIQYAKLYKTITLEGNELRWFIGGVSVVDSILYEDGEFLGILLTGNQTVSFSYTPDKNDKIFDIVLYVKLNGVFVQEGVE